MKNRFYIVSILLSLALAACTQTLHLNRGNITVLLFPKNTIRELPNSCPVRLRFRSIAHWRRKIRVEPKSIGQMWYLKR